MFSKYNTVDPMFIEESIRSVINSIFALNGAANFPFMQPFGWHWEIAESKMFALAKNHTRSIDCVQQKPPGGHRNETTDGGGGKATFEADKLAPI